MSVSTISFNVSAVRRASVAVTAVALLAACNTDRALEPTAPTAASIPVAAQPTVIAGAPGALAWTVVTQVLATKTLIGGAKFQLTGARINMIVTDNGANDENLVLGKFKLSGLKPGSFSLCEITAPSGYAIPSPSCHQLTVYSNATTSDEFINAPLPSLTVAMRDPLQKLVGGGSVKIDNPGAGVSMVVTDNDAKDLDPAVGLFRVMLPAAGAYTVCPLTAPTGYAIWTALGGGLCQMKQMRNGWIWNLGAMIVYPIPSLYWQAVDAATYGLIGGGTYTISIPNESFSITVTDNGPTDFMSAPGKVLVKLPKAATYKVCEVQPPANYKPAQLSCLQFFVGSSLPTMGANFMNVKK